ncbi:MAG TPA: hypothetical protein VN437_02975, partial [Rectinemataceae bacterium]|nr:hypothetical protein [Rectinemataceae bacterium]
MRTNIHPDEALVLIVDVAQRNFPRPATEKVPIEAALGRALALSIASPIDHPPFDKSAMDGFAFSKAAATSLYRVIDSVSAGRSSGAELKRGEAIRIMTGAPIPNGADAVQRIEWTEEAGHDAASFPLVLFSKPETIDNIIR